MLPGNDGEKNERKDKMKKLMIGLGAVAALALAGCVAPVGPTISNGVMGGIVTDHVAPAGYNIDNGVKADRCGRATAQGIVLFTTGDNSINAAMKNGGISKVHHVDVEMLNIFNVYSRVTTVVWGE